MSSRSTEVSHDPTARGRSDTRALPSRLYAPRFWPTWIGLGLIRLLGLLPYRVQMAIGASLGRIAYYFARRDRRIASSTSACACLSSTSAARGAW